MKLSSAVCLIDGRKAAEVEHRQVPLWSQKVCYNTIKRYECCSVRGVEKHKTDFHPYAGVLTAGSAEVPHSC